MPKVEVRPIAEHVARHLSRFDPYYEGSNPDAKKELPRPAKPIKRDAVKTARDSGKIDWSTVERYKLMGIALPPEIVEAAAALARGESLPDDDHE